MKKHLPDILQRIVKQLLWGDNCPDEFSAIVSPLHISLNSGDEIYFKHITKISDSVYECVVACSVGYTTENHDYSENFWQVYVDNTSEGQTEIFTITIDGDYLRYCYACLCR